MGRKSTDLRMKNGRTSLQVLWEAVRSQREEFTIASLVKTTKQKQNTVGEYVRRWQKGGVVSVMRENKEGNGRTYVYRLERDTGIEAPRLRRDGTPMLMGRINEALWIAMRIVREFTAEELAVYASVSQAISYDTARKYCRFLSQAGYLKVTQMPVRQGMTNRYMLLPAKNTGPRPPVIQITHNVFDPNLGRVVWTSPLNEEEADDDK